MPRVVDLSFSAAYATERDALIATARRSLSVESAGVKAVGKWLEVEYSEAKVRKALESRRQEHRRRSYGQPMTPEAVRRSPSSDHDPDLPGDDLRADRLRLAFTDLHGRNQRQDLRKLLSPNLPRSERETNALRAIVVSAIVVDPDVDEWLASVTPLASCPYHGDDSAKPPVKGREDVAALWAHEALGLLKEACDLLGWETAVDPVGTAAPSVDEADATGLTVDSERFEIRWRGKRCDLGDHIDELKILGRLERRRMARVSTTTLAEMTDSTVDSVPMKVKRLKKHLREAGMDPVAEAIHQKTVDKELRWYLDHGV